MRERKRGKEHKDERENFRIENEEEGGADVERLDGLMNGGQ